MPDLLAIDRDTQPTPLIAKDVREYFTQSVTAAMGNQQLSASDEATYYIVNLLAQFTRADALFERTPDGTTVKPLAMIYAEAVEAATPGARRYALKRLGDVALLISGMFSASLNRKLVNMDYYIAMGGSAYGSLSTVSSMAPSRTFAELAEKFQAFVEVLGEVSDKSSLRAPTDLMRTYETWARTGSKRAASQLRELGIEPSVGSISLRQN